MTPAQFAKRRKRLGSQSQVAEAFGFSSKVQISRIENGFPRRIHALALRCLEDHPDLMEPEAAP